jgi:hypothetical protein
MAMRNVSGGKGSPGVAGGTYTRPAPKATKSLKKATKNASKIVGKDVSKPGTLEKMSQNMTQAEKIALSNKLKKANVVGKKGVGIAGKQAKDGVVKVNKSNSDIDAAHLAAAYAKSVKASKAAGLDPTKVKVTYKGKTMGYKG